MKIELCQEDQMTSEILDRLTRDGEAALEEAELVLECAELLALMPYGLDPIEPREALWQKIAAQVAERKAGGEAARKPAPTLIPFPERHAASAEPVPQTPAPVLVPASHPAGRGLLALAASLALCLVGLGYLLAQTRFQQTTIAELRSAQASSLEVRHHYDMVRRTARQYYPLYPVSLSPREEPFYGRVWVCGMHQQWLLNIEGLKPAPRGHEYHFWFETEDGKVDGGVVEVTDGEAQLSASSMPLGTKGFSVTLEAVGSHARKPEGRVLLVAQEAHDIVLGIEDLRPSSKDVSM